jgi:hypothetical protein
MNPLELETNSDNYPGNKAGGTLRAPNCTQKSIRADAQSRTHANGWRCTFRLVAIGENFKAANGCRSSHSGS